MSVQLTSRMTRTQQNRVSGCYWIHSSVGAWLSPEGSLVVEQWRWRWWWWCWCWAIIKELMRSPPRVLFCWCCVASGPRKTVQCRWCGCWCWAWGCVSVGRAIRDRESIRSEIETCRVLSLLWWPSIRSFVQQSHVILFYTGGASIVIVVINGTGQNLIED